MKGNMKVLFTSLLLAMVVPVVAQESSENLKALVKAEWDFINLARDTNTRDAFLAQFTEETIVFGEGPVNAKRAYQNQQPNNGWLKWEPVFSDLASSGDFGYNTGPWEFRINKTDAKAVAFGHFVSFWHQQTDGSWKLLIDIGVDHAQPTQTPAWKSSAVEFERISNPSEERNPLETVEQNFIEALAFAKSPAYQAVLSRETRFYRPGIQAITEQASILTYLNGELPITYKKVGQALASTGDLGYAYGTAVVQLKGNQTKAANYLHVWKHEKNAGWKLVLDLITYK